MRSNSVHNSHLSQSIAVVIFSLWLSACGGGISGTGDGGPIVTQPTESINSTGSTDTVDTSSDTVPESPADTGVSDQDGPATPTAVDINLLLPDLSLLVPDTLLQVNAQGQSVSATVPFTAQLITLTQEVTETINAISGAQATPMTEINSQFSDSRFNNMLSFSLQGTETIAASSNDTDLRFFFSNNPERAIHLLQQDGTITLRRVDRSDNSVFQARIVSRADSSVIRADLNINGIPSYLESYSTAEITAAFSQHPTDPTVPRRRELIDPAGVVLVVQNCTGAADCFTNSGFSNTDATGLQFSSATQAIEAALPEPVNSPLITLPDGVTEAVLAVTESAQPTEDQIQCGVQTVDDNIQLFCLRPLALETNGSLFSETVSGGEIFYQRLQ